MRLDQALSLNLDVTVVPEKHDVPCPYKTAAFDTGGRSTGLQNLS